MADAALTYWDFAANDRTFFREAYDNGIKGSALVSIGKYICERYLKHLIAADAEAMTGAEANAREHTLQTHNLQVLVKYIHKYMETDVPQELEDILDQINSFGMQTMYPGPDSFFPTEKDIDKANAAVERTRCFALEACGKKKEGKG